MDSETAWTLANPPHPGHIVYRYTNDSHMVSAVALYASTGLAGAGSVVLIATEEHRYAIKRHLSGDGNVEVFERNGQLLFLDAAGLLSTFMVDGYPDPKLFKFGITTLMERAGHDPYTGRKREVRLFGEMVNLLWPSNSAAAERLEELGNEIIEEYSIPIL